MKIKEKIKKIGNRKYCLLLALLILALLFTVLTPKINLGTQKASALSAPQEKTLELNGESYSYQTSLKELKNNYGLFDKQYTNDYIQFFEDTEGQNHIIIYGTNGVVTEANQPKLADYIKNNVTLYINSEKYNGDFIYDTNSTDNSSITWEDTVENKFALKNLTNININLSDMVAKATPATESPQKFTDGVMATFYYINETISENADLQVLYNNSKILGTVFNKPINYNFNIKKIEGYRLYNIIISFQDVVNVAENEIIFNSQYPSADMLNYKNIDSTQRSNLIIDNLDFIKNNDANILNYNVSYYNYLDNWTGEVLFKGSLLLSRSKMDANMLEYFNGVNAPITTVVTQSFESPVFFGATNNTGKRVTNIYYCKKEDGGALPSPYVLGEFYLLFEPPSLSTSHNDIICSSVAGTLSPLYPNNWINFTYQNQLLSVPEAQNLRISSTEYTGAGLSAQVEDVLYNVEYLGNTEKIQQEEEIKKDFENMLYVTGAFAVIGLLLGFVFGNPILGLVIGAVVGFGLTIVPIILDGLQAIFGQQFLDGLQNFFRTIASSIANVVSSILNFLFGIITNPAVLVLVLIVAILYLFVFRNKE